MLKTKFTFHRLEMTFLPFFLLANIHITILNVFSLFVEQYLPDAMCVNNYAIMVPTFFAANCHSYTLLGDKVVVAIASFFLTTHVALEQRHGRGQVFLFLYWQ